MTENEAKSQAYQIWLKWEGRSGGGNMLGMRFFVYLKNNHSHLLTFPCSGDRYQIVKPWVEDWQRFDNIQGY